MRQKPKFTRTKIRVNTSVEGEHLSTSIRRMIENKEPIGTTGVVSYTRPNEGVLAQFDIRTDRFEIAMQAQDKAARYHNAKNQEALKAEQAQTEPEAEKA